jgi:hypothetical protein
MKAFMGYVLKASALAVAGISVAATGAFAQTATTDVPFQGIVGKACVFGAPTAGTLGLSTPRNLTSTSGVGSAGTVRLTCTGQATLTVSNPVNTSPLSPLNGTNSSAAATVNDLGNSFIPLNSGASGAIGLAGQAYDNTLEVNLEVQKTTAGPIPDGTYDYTVTLTAAPL